MTEDVKIIVDAVIKSNIEQQELDELVERIKGYADFGLIMADQNNEIFVDADLIQKIYDGGRAVRAAFNEYGKDEIGFVQYPFD